MHAVSCFVVANFSHQSFAAVVFEGVENVALLLLANYSVVK